MSASQIIHLASKAAIAAEATAIGKLYERAGMSFIESVEALAEAGRLLIEIKETMPHGAWLRWLDANAETLGFVKSTAQRLMNAARLKTAPARYLDKPAALKISREIWGHKVAHVSANSGDNEWYTPSDIIERARAVLGGFDLDPASSQLANETVNAAQIFTAADDGRSQEWPVGRIWMNPPYAQPLIGQFCQRFADEIGRGSTGIALVNNATETDWFQTLSACATAICFPRGRVRFLDENGDPGTPLQGQAIIYCGPDSILFNREFAGVGLVVRVLP